MAEGERGAARDELRCLRCAFSMDGFGAAEDRGEGPKSSEVPEDGSVVVCGECGKAQVLSRSGQDSGQGSGQGSGEGFNVAPVTEEMMHQWVREDRMDARVVEMTIEVARQKQYEWSAKVMVTAMHMMAVRFAASRGRPLEIDIPSSSDRTALHGVAADHEEVFERLCAGRQETRAVLTTLLRVVQETCESPATFFQLQCSVDFLLETGRVDETVLKPNRSWCCDDLLASLAANPRYRTIMLSNPEKHGLHNIDRSN